ncbi:serpin family protein [Candidatus Woesearchaeota archaeon]|nr:serpin family protein [Candidatus Woesearchaeota archaeon]
MLDDSEATIEGVKSVINANNQFALELYSKLNSETENAGKNLFFSPYSISTAFAMTYEGARGQTAEEMQQVFHFPADDLTRRSAFARIYNNLNSGSKDYQLSTANSLWTHKDYSFLPEYLGTVEKYYGGKATNLDFVLETEKSRVIINDWVEEQTQDKIKDIIPEGAITYLTRLVLSNAIYFKGTWVKEFEKKDTRDAQFRVSPDKTVTVKMMVRDDKEAKFSYAEADELQILEMLYKGEELSMLVLLPKEPDYDLSSIESILTADKLSQWRGLLSERQIDVYMPKFTFETKYSMVDTFKEMGMPSAFTNADFSGMDGSRKLVITDVFHQAFVDVNEEGTEAAAATVIIMGETSAGPFNQFRADHPFIFIIQQRETGNILFIGRVMDPTAK